MAKHGKKYLEAAKLVDATRVYPPEEAIAQAKKAAWAAFDETVELHVRLGVDPRHADQQVRGVAQLPHGLGRRVRVLVFAQGEAARIAEAAGADYVGSDDLVQRIQGGWLDFDVALATREVVSMVGRLGRILGRRGLMPNPRSGTVVAQEDLPRAIEEARRGRVEFRVDRTSLVHVPFGKVSFEDEKLLENLTSMVNALVRARPSGAKGQYVRRISISTTMGPGIRLDLRPTLALSMA